MKYESEKNNILLYLFYGRNSTKYSRIANVKLPLLPLD